MKIKDKVLIVEDEKSISNFISMILQANGFDTIVVRTGEEALTMISSHCPDLILLDLVDLLLLTLPLGLLLRLLLLEVGDLLVQLFQFRLIILPFDGLTLDLQLFDTT